MYLFFYTCVIVSMISFIGNHLVICFQGILALVVCYGFTVTKIKPEKDMAIKGFYRTMF